MHITFMAYAFFRDAVDRAAKEDTQEQEQKRLFECKCWWKDKMTKCKA